MSILNLLQHADSMLLEMYAYDDEFSTRDGFEWWAEQCQWLRDRLTPEERAEYAKRTALPDPRIIYTTDRDGNPFTIYCDPYPHRRGAST